MRGRRIASPQEHVRMALHLLDELDHEVGAVGLIPPQQYTLVRLLAATRRQLWLAVAAGEGPRGARSWSAAERRARGRGWFRASIAALGSALGVLTVLIRSLWRSLRSFMRLIYLIGSRA